jgi:flagellar assembly protein FliH
MMTSLSNNSEANGNNRDVAGQAPVRLIGLGVREISRLEFYSMDRSEVTTDVVLESEPAAIELLLKAEVATLDRRLRSQTEQISTRVEMARVEARAEARRDWESELEDKIVEERALILKIGEEFRRERTKYFAGVESEVVKLALAIAARVLHREAKLDPLLLSGVVKVALEKVADDSATVLHVPVSELQMWQRVFVTDTESSLQLVGDERMGSGECVLNTNIGKVELGVSAQLEEIERGFFDLMQQRPTCL